MCLMTVFVCASVRFKKSIDHYVMISVNIVASFQTNLRLKCSGSETSAEWVLVREEREAKERERAECAQLERSYSFDKSIDHYVMISVAIWCFFYTDRCLDCSPCV